MSYCNAEYAMFQVLKGLRGVGDACMLRVVTYSVFLINEILENLFFFFFFNIIIILCLPVSLFPVCLICHSSPSQLHNFNIQTDQRWNGACWLHWMNLTTKWPLVQHKHSANAWSLWAPTLQRLQTPGSHTQTHNSLRLLTHTSVQLSFLFPPPSFPVIPCLFCVCFSHCTKCKRQIKISI